MKKTCIALSFIMMQQGYAQIQYPVSRKVDTVDNYHGTAVPDPYRWLEDDNSKETKTWVKSQNNVTQDYLSKIPYRVKFDSVYRNCGTTPVTVHLSKRAVTGTLPKTTAFKTKVFGTGKKS